MHRKFLFLTLTAVAALLTSCAKKQEQERKNFFKKDEYKQGKMFRLAQHMSYNELKEEFERFDKAGNQTLAIKFLEHMIKKCEDPNVLPGLRLRMADLLFSVQRYADAAQDYQMYAHVYPGSESTPYAEFKVIQATDAQVLNADLDQEKTQQIIDQAKDFGRKALTNKRYEPYVKRVEQMAHNALYRLYEGEMLRFYFYLNRSLTKAADARLTWIKEKFAKYLDELEPEILELECALAIARGDQKTQAEKCTLLAQKFPKYTKKPERKWRYALPF